LVEEFVRKNNTQADKEIFNKKEAKNTQIKKTCLIEIISIVRRFLPISKTLKILFQIHLIETLVEIFMTEYT